MASGVLIYLSAQPGVTSAAGRARRKGAPPLILFAFEGFRSMAEALVEATGIVSSPFQAGRFENSQLHVEGNASSGRRIGSAKELCRL